MSVDHYENFPVASLLCPPHLRPAVRAIYHFARTADDIADEGTAPAAERVAELQRYRAALHRGRITPADQQWRGIFDPLARCTAEHGLSVKLLDDLLDAFIQDCANPRYATRAELLDYCRRSANPIGRLLLQLYRIDDVVSLQQSDAICTALQLINFWQDPSVDLPRGRSYFPAEDLRRHGVTDADLMTRRNTAATRALLADLLQWARGLMLQGAPLASRLPGRMGWELRLVVQGGLRIVERIERMQHGTLSHRPTLRATDAPRMLWRAWRMAPTAATAR